MDAKTTTHITSIPIPKRVRLLVENISNTSVTHTASRPYKNNKNNVNYKFNNNNNNYDNDNKTDYLHTLVNLVKNRSQNKYRNPR